MPAFLPLLTAFVSGPNSITVPANDPVPTVRIVSMVEKIQRGDDAGMDELYQIFSKGVRFLICRQLGIQDCDDVMHEIFMIVVQAIRRGELRDPQCLMGYVRTVARCQVIIAIERRVQGRREDSDMEMGRGIAERRKNPEEHHQFRERVELMKSVLRELSVKDREILTRFYLREETQEEICLQMGYTNTQFRLLKSRAKDRFGELGKKKLSLGALVGLTRRTRKPLNAVARIVLRNTGNRSKTLIQSGPHLGSDGHVFRHSGDQP